MGTETNIDFVLWMAYQGIGVKLNNPLMGTETVRNVAFFYFKEHIRLN